MNKIIKNTLILTAITLISGLLLGMVYEITKDPIAASQEKARQEAYKAVLKEADSFADYADFDEKEVAKAVKDISGCTVNGVAEAKDNSGETIGNDGVVEGVEILSISETAGLGMKATEAKFRDQYVGKTVEAFTVTKTGASSDEEIDALSGATITSNAVTNAVNAGLAYFNHVIGGSANE